MKDGCWKCRELLDLATLATLRHMRALTRLELAELRGERDLLPALQIVVGETCRSRIKAQEAYKQHQSMHETAASGGAA